MSALAFALFGLMVALSILGISVYQMWVRSAGSAGKKTTAPAPRRSGLSLCVLR